MFRKSTIWLAILLTMSAVDTNAAKPNTNDALSPTEVLTSIQKTAPEIEKLLTSLRGADAAVRQSTMAAMVESNNAALVSSAINEARASSDPVLRDLAVRAAFREIAQFVPETISELSDEGKKAYIYFSTSSDSLKIEIDKYSWADGKFSTKTGATGQVSAGQLSFSSQYCQGKLLVVPGTWSYEGIVTCGINSLQLHERMRVHIR